MRTPDQNLEIYQNQLTELKSQFDFFEIIITCADCNRQLRLFNMFRCFECGLYLCGNCCPKHFGMPKPERLQTMRNK